MPSKHSRLAAIAVALGLLALDITPAGAVLPPYWQSAKEIETILNDQGVHDAFKYEEPILSISTTTEKVYEIRTPRCTLSVTVVDKPPAAGVVGPQNFDLKIGEADCQ